MTEDQLNRIALEFMIKNPQYRYLECLAYFAVKHQAELEPNVRDMILFEYGNYLHLMGNAGYETKVPQES